MVVFHKLDLVKIGNRYLTKIMALYHNYLYVFINNIFTNKYEVILESEVDFCPMNAISGPFASFSQLIQSQYLSQCGVPFVEIRDIPDIWAHAYLDPTTCDLNPIHIPHYLWRSGQSIKPKTEKSREIGPKMPII